MNIRYRVGLSEMERAHLHRLISGGKHAARKLSGKETALLVATACSSPPLGRKCWTLKLLAGEMVRLTGQEDLSHETVRRRLAKDDLKPWQQDMWCIPQVDGTYVARMEAVLDRYPEEPDPKRPVVGFDGSPMQLIGEVRQPIPAKPGQAERFDYEYRGNGTANLFGCLFAHRAWRHVKVTDRRTAKDYAGCMRDLVDTHYLHAERIRVVLDNLPTYGAGALYETFAAPEAHRILQGLEFYYTPKHASWLNGDGCAVLACGGSLRGGRDRDRRVARPVPRPPHRRAQRARDGNPGMAGSSQRSRCSYSMEVHDPEGTQQARPRLSRHSQRVTILVTRY